MSRKILIYMNRYIYSGNGYKYNVFIDDDKTYVKYIHEGNNSISMPEIETSLNNYYFYLNRIKNSIARGKLVSQYISLQTKDKKYLKTTQYKNIIIAIMLADHLKEIV